MNPQENNQDQTPYQPQTDAQTASMEPATQSQPVQVPPAPVAKIGKFKASRMIVKESWAILKQDKELALFPIVSSIVSLIALIVMFVVFFFVSLSGSLANIENMGQTGADAIFYAVLFVYYVIMFTITNYFLAAMYTIINARFNGQDLSFSDGISSANRNFSRIFIWSVISATVGVVLEFISNKSKIIGSIVAAIFGAAWAILTYFSLPSLIIGKTTVKGSFKESASLIRKTWGETIIVNFGVGLFFALLMLIGLVASIALVALVPIVEILILVVILFVMYMIALIIISTTLSSIFKLAIYQYAKTGIVPAGFTPSLIAGAVKSGK